MKHFSTVSAARPSASYLGNFSLYCRTSVPISILFSVFLASLFECLRTLTVPVVVPVPNHLSISKQTSQTSHGIVNSYPANFSPRLSPRECWLVSGGCGHRPPTSPRRSSWANHLVPLAHFPNLQFHTFNFIERHPLSRTSR